tara:strand:+ start:198 stop:590 length:393 start_codon:yes stop_codon:yes gene_type:complete
LKDWCWKQSIPWFYRFLLDLAIVSIALLTKGEAMIRFHNPAAKTAVAPELYELSCDIRPQDGNDLTVGLLANGFPDSEVFIRKVGEAIQKRLPNITTKLWNKGNAGVPASEEMLKEIAQSCQVAIAAYGH